MLPGVREGTHKLNIRFELCGAGTLDRVPLLNDEVGRTVAPHPQNIRPQDSAGEEYVEKIARYGVSAGCRGEAWAVWSGSNR